MTRNLSWLLLGISIGLVVGMLVGVLIAVNSLGVDIRFPWEAIPTINGGYTA